MKFLHKYSVAQQFGGQEEGGWWFDTGYPEWRFGIPLPLPEEWCYKIARFFNRREHERQDREEEYSYSSVLSYRSNHYAYQLEDHFVSKPYPETRPHYE